MQTQTLDQSLLGLSFPNFLLNEIELPCPPIPPTPTGPWRTFLYMYVNLLTTLFPRRTSPSLTWGLSEDRTLSLPWVTDPDGHSTNVPRLPLRIWSHSVLFLCSKALTELAGFPPVGLRLFFSRQRPELSPVLLVKTKWTAMQLVHLLMSKVAHFHSKSSPHTYL